MFAQFLVYTKNNELQLDAQFLLAKNHIRATDEDSCPSASTPTSFQQLTKQLKI